MKKRVLIPLAPGFEELEAVAMVDLLRRAGAHVVTASVDAPNPIVGRNRLRMMADIDLDEALDEWGDAWDLVALPGGKGVEGLAANPRLMQLLRARLEAGQPVAAICAAPLVLAKAGLPKGAILTSWPGVRETLEASAEWRDAPVVVAGSLITGRGAGASIAFAEALVEALFGATTRDELVQELGG